MNLKEKLEAGKKDYLYYDVLIKGTNISVREVLRELAYGRTVDEVLEANPGMTNSDIQTCLHYALELVGAIDFNKAMLSINIVVKKRESFLANIRKMRSEPNLFQKYIIDNTQEKTGESDK
jgi:uncharacterized protein (DUF433 family)